MNYQCRDTCRDHKTSGCPFSFYFTQAGVNLSKPDFCPQIMGNSSEFKNAVQLVLDNVSFEKDSNVQVFEATIRYILYSMLTSIISQ